MTLMKSRYLKIKQLLIESWRSDVLLNLNGRSLYILVDFSNLIGRPNVINAGCNSSTQQEVVRLESNAQLLEEQEERKQIAINWFAVKVMHSLGLSPNRTAFPNQLGSARSGEWIKSPDQTEPEPVKILPICFGLIRSRLVRSDRTVRWFVMNAVLLIHLKVSVRESWIYLAQKSEVKFIFRMIRCITVSWIFPIQI